jgi:hypothetical protein
MAAMSSMKKNMTTSSMKKSTTAPMKKQKKQSSSEEKKMLNTISMPSMLVSAGLIGACAYLCVFDYDHHFETAMENYGSAYNTVRLSQCAPKDASKSAKVDLEDLEIAHSQLGFAASELVELSRNMEKIVKNNLSESVKRNETVSSPCANCTLPSCAKMPHFRDCPFKNFTVPHMPELNLTNLTQEINLTAFGNTLADSFKNITNTSFDTHVETVRNSSQKVYNHVANATASVKNATADVVSNCTGCLTEKAGKVYEDVFKTELKKDLAIEWEKRMGGVRGGALRFSVNDAVQQIGGIFSTCNTTDPSTESNELIARRFPSATFSESSEAGKTIMRTTVADGFLFEARTIVGGSLWTDVKLTRGDFEISLKRDKVGLVYAFVNGIKMGEI